jgi:hypothetical protein
MILTATERFPAGLGKVAVSEVPFGTTPPTQFPAVSQSPVFGSFHVAEVAPKQNIGKRQEARGKRQEARGKRQEARGKRQEARGKRKRSASNKGFYPFQNLIESSILLCKNEFFS